MKFLVIAQDLRVSGTSEGIVSRSFLARLRQVFPESFIKVVYLKHSKSDDDLHLLPVNELTVKQVTIKFPLLLIWINKIFWRVFKISLNEIYKYRIYRKHLATISIKEFDHVFIRSSGLEFETILGAKGLPLLKKAILNFHDPFPVLENTGPNAQISGLDLIRFKWMREVIDQSKACMSPASYLSRELETLYGARKTFYTLAHQYEESVFDLTDKVQVFQKRKQITISYHGALQFGRNIDELLDAYRKLVQENDHIEKNTEFVVRLKSAELDRIKEKYAAISNIRVLAGVNFSNAAYEQKYLSDLNVLLENGPKSCNILLGKAPFLAAIEKPVFVLAPPKSELREIITKKEFIATYGSIVEIKEKLEKLILNIFANKDLKCDFDDYFHHQTFKRFIHEILMSGEQ